MRYPNFNDHPYTQRPVLATHGATPLGELVWLALPIIALALAFLLH